MRSTLLSVLLLAGFAVLGVTANLEIYENQQFLQVEKRRDKKDRRGQDDDQTFVIPAAFVQDQGMSTNQSNVSRTKACEY